MNRTQTLLFAANVLATLTLLAAVLVAYVWPQYMARVHMTEQSMQILMLNLISFLLLCAWLGQTGRRAWRCLTLIAAFVVLCESWLMGLY